MFSPYGATPDGRGQIVRPIAIDDSRNASAKRHEIAREGAAGIASLEMPREP